MILQALARRYEREARRAAVPTYGFKAESISYAVVLDVDGTVVNTLDLRNVAGKRPRPSLRYVPREEGRRTSNVKSHFLWDKTAYVFGVKKDERSGSPVPTDRGEHAAFLAFHRRLLKDADDVGIRAFLAFLDHWTWDRFTSLDASEEMLDTNIVFCVDDGSSRPEFLHDRLAAKGIWLRYLEDQEADDNDHQFCLVTGEFVSPARLHTEIKGVLGAEPSGAQVVSFNEDAFESFRKRKGANAPVSNRAAFAYTTALNSLLAQGSRNKIQIGDATTVFWAEAGGDCKAEEAAENQVAAWMGLPSPTDQQESAKLRDKLENIHVGRPKEQTTPGVQNETRFFILGLAPNAARLSVRFWYADTFGRLELQIRRHGNDLRIEPVPWKTEPAARRLLLETAVRRKRENVPPVLGGSLMNAILRGSRYPRSLLTSVLLRMRSDPPPRTAGERRERERSDGYRAAICKACLARDYRLGHEKEDVPVSLNPEEMNPAYQLGRLFAIYEGVQRAALGSVNATIRDQFYGSASSTPASVFPLLDRKANHHLGTLRKDKPGLAIRYEQHLQEVFGRIATNFPRSLRIEDQGRFTIGYYHQRSKLFEPTSA